MKIKTVEPVLVSLPYEQGAPKPVSSPIVSWEKVNILFVRVETDEGVVGWGEAFGILCSDLTARAVSDVVAKVAVGRTITKASALSDDLRRSLNSVARAGGPVAFALSGLDIALWDIEGKVSGQPVWRLLGGVGREAIPAYASLFRLGEPRYVQKLCADAVQRGYRAIKLHEYTVDAVEAARRGAGPGVDIMVDVNCHWTSHDEVVAFCESSAPFGVSWLEEPLYPSDDYAAHARLRRAVETPIAGGENLANLAEMRVLLEAGGVDIVQPSPAKIGGVTDVWRSVALARENGVRCVPHSPFHGPALMATIHIIASMPEDVSCELRYCDLAVNPLGPLAEARGGMIRVPQGPGLGVDVDLEIIRKYRVG